MRGCRELQKNSRVGEREEAAMSCPEVPEIGRNEGKRGAAVSCRELQGNVRIGERGEAAVSCHEVPKNCINEKGRGV